MSTLESHAEEPLGREYVAQSAMTTARSRYLWGATAGAAAGLAASGVMLWAGEAWGGAILPQLISERATAIVPLDVFRRGLEALESNAKPLTLLGITLGQMLGGAAIGALYATRAADGVRQRLLGGAALALLVWLLLGLVGAPLGDIGLFAVDAPGGFWETQLVFGVSALVFGALLALSVPLPSVALEADADDGRRRLLKLGAFGALALPAGWSLFYVGRQARDLRDSYDPGLGTRTADGASIFEAAGMPEQTTPTDAYYVVSKNFVDPEVNSVDWTLEVGGLVERALTLSFTDILNRETTDFAATLECISNGIGGSYISNTIWTGFPLRELLDEAGLKPGVIDIELHAADGYIESIPLAEGLAEDTMLVHSMLGEALTYKHGFPLRLIVPGIFGMKNVKWITKINAVDQDIQGYWQERGWSDIATVVTMSRIDVPRRASKVKVGELVTIGGVAFAGDRGISMVELSLDGGVTWQETQLAEEQSKLAWRLWAYEYQATQPGPVSLVVRATDGDGELQTEVEREALPDGATGWHHNFFEIEEL
jgi:DMSO/TMAO reductase YedYZ molybdopterin-dependent catalytic subunit